MDVIRVAIEAVDTQAEPVKHGYPCYVQLLPHLYVCVCMYSEREGGRETDPHTHRHTQTHAAAHA